ncbi:MAG: aminodeoxychorismate/anthranilate synthase component II [Methanospirillaceae archaeon]|nr:aminodeoxychorismate/anthranilate synthase component II [Methanospirillaceae archaeon]
MNLLIIDCYDSFTYNLYQLAGELGVKADVITSDRPLREAEDLGPDRIILSPGPGTPKESGICQDIVQKMSHDVPTLGVCLGHQTICAAGHAEIIRAFHLMHGKTSEISHTGSGIFEGVVSPFPATRYHSLIVDEATLPSDLVVTARSTDDGYVMGVEHRRYPIYGIQFHPESIMTRQGRAILSNFLFDGVRCR